MSDIFSCLHFVKFRAEGTYLILKGKRMKRNSVRLGIVGATGLVGRTFLKVIEEKKMNFSEIRLFASEKSVGKTLKCGGRLLKVQALSENGFENLDYVLFSAGAEVSGKWAPLAADSGAYVIDNSSKWRRDPECALIVPEINPNDYAGKSKIISNPNCSTIQSVMVLKPLNDAYRLKSVSYTTYQSVSGAGQKGIDDFFRGKRNRKPKYFPHDISKNLIPEIDAPARDGYTKEEIKMVDETRKILHLPDLKVSATCVRVPLERTHGVVIQCVFEEEPDVDRARKLLEEFSGIEVVDDLRTHRYPLAEQARNNDKVYVGRIRKDLACRKGLLLFVVSDNIRKGAASNAVQILEYLIEKNR